MIHLSSGRLVALVLCLILIGVLLGGFISRTQNRRIAAKEYYADWKWITRASGEILEDRKILSPKNAKPPDSAWLKEQLILRITRAVNDIELKKSGGGGYEVKRIKDEAPKWYEEQERKRNNALSNSP